MYGDTAVIRRLADELARIGHEIETDTAALAAQAEAVHWAGLAGDAMRAVTGARVLALRRTSALHDDAAELLRVHAAEVDRRKAAIAAVEAAARRVLADPVGSVLDLVVPPSGHRDWLSVELPDLPDLPGVDLPGLS